MFQFLCWISFPDFLRCLYDFETAQMQILMSNVRNVDRRVWVDVEIT